MQDFSAGSNMMTSSCGDVNSSQHFIDSGSNKTSLNHASKQVNPHIPQLHTLNQLRSQQGLMQQPMVQISNLQLPQQILQNQFLKPGQSAHIGPVLPTGSFPNIFSALQYQILVQALQQGLIPVPQTSQPLPIINSVGTSHNSQSPICRLNSSFSFPATSNILKVNGTSSLQNKDTSKSGQATAESSSTHALPPHPSFGENFVTQVSEESSFVSASIGCVTAEGMTSRSFTSMPSSFHLAGMSSVIESCNVTNSCEAPVVASSLRDSLSKQDLSDNQTRMILGNPSDLSNANLFQEKTQTTCSKAEVLTHIIEGYIIQEGSRPFPVERSMYINEFLDSENEGSNEMTDEDDENDLEQVDTTKAFALKAKNDTKAIGSEETKQCHCCGIFFHPKASVSKTGKFCSVTCSKRTAACSRWMIHYASKGLLNEKTKSRRISGMLPSKKSRNAETDDDFSDIEEGKEGKGSAKVKRASIVSKNMQLSPYPECSKSQQPCADNHSSNKAPEASQKFEKGTLLEASSSEKISECDASMWGVYEVCDFIQSLSGCGMYAEDFKKQEIDGQALLLLTEEHLMSTMNIKLGPALKICSNIRTLKVSPTPHKNAN